MPTIKVNDINIYYEIHGRGSPLVLILGLGSDISEPEWQPLISGLAKKYRVITLDNRGAGRTDKPDVPYTVEMMANDTFDLIRALKIRNAEVMGVSLGGRIALELTLRHRKMVRKLVLVSTSARVVKTLKRILLVDIMHRIFPGKQPGYAFRKQSKASSSYDCTRELSRIRVPTLIMYGRRDDLVKRGLVDELHSGIKGSELVTFNGGHIFFVFGELKQLLDTTFKFLGDAGQPKP